MAQKKYGSLPWVLILSALGFFVYAFPCPAGDDATLVSETIPANTTITVGRAFTKTWTLKNTGTTVWSNHINISYTINFSNGDRLGADTTRIFMPIYGIYPGKTVTFTVNLTAPNVVGTYTGYWQMQNDSGVNFGPILSVRIEVPMPQLDDGLVGYWKFDNPSNLGWDSSPLGNHGTCSDNDVSYVDKGAVYGAARFVPGNNRAITVPDNRSLDFKDGISVAAWVNMDAGNEGYQAIISKSDLYFNEAYGLWASLWHTATEKSFSAYFSGADDYDDSHIVVPTRTWVHLAMTYDGRPYGIIMFYVNGQLVQFQRSMVPWGMVTNASKLHIGASPTGHKEDYSGLMDEVRLYNRPLYADEIARLTEKKNGVSLPWWQME